MKLRNMLPYRSLVSLGLLTAFVEAQSDGLVQEYCSTQNTGSSYQGVYNIYQSNGACRTQCEGSYAFAIVQDFYCWCSNYIPSSQVSTSQCSETCPGYPTDLCGNISSGLFGYIALTLPPSGTLAAANAAGIANTATTRTSVSRHVLQDILPTGHHPHDPTAPFPESVLLLQDRDYTPSTTSQNNDQDYNPTYFTRSTSSSSSLQTSILTGPLQATSTSSLQTATVIPVTVTQSQGATTVVSYVTLTPSTTSTSRTSSSDTSTSSSSSSDTSASTSSSTLTSYSLSAQVVTVSGQVVTQTVTTTPLAGTAQDASNLQVSQKDSLSGGAIAGIVIGVLAGIAILALAGLLLWRRRRQQDRPEGVVAAGAATEEKPPPKRNTSVLSRSGLLARMGHDNTETNPFDEPTNGGMTSQRHSMLFGAGAASAEGVSPHSPLGTTYSGDSRRHSKPMVYDQRLNPSALFSAHDNGSRVSMQDGADYSRTLGVTNPDPRPSWESRTSRG